VAHVDLVSIGEREKIVVDTLGDNKKSTSFYCHIGDDTGKDYQQEV